MRDATTNAVTAPSSPSQCCHLLVHRLPITSHPHGRAVTPSRLNTPWLNVPGCDRFASADLVIFKSILGIRSEVAIDVAAIVSHSPQRGLNLANLRYAITGDRSSRCGLNGRTRSPDGCTRRQVLCRRKLCVLSGARKLGAALADFNIGLLLSGSYRERDSIAFAKGLICAALPGFTCTTIGLVVPALAWAPIPALKCALLRDTADRPRVCPCVRDAVTEIKSIENILLVRTLLTTTGNLISTWP